ncbi:hypothetical protein GBAR_LOCUS1704 [Geodia barretti]|uniref:Uncharacterized protein n=1 Tax=Geodia barretti TaxID=519541 RepID=A0AA35QY52_GEOBA|nr:hypothetical protein GBAR_LOCUS1704 [Geodia barretti]
MGSWPAVREEAGRGTRLLGRGRSNRGRRRNQSNYHPASHTHPLLLPWQRSLRNRLHLEWLANLLLVSAVEAVLLFVRSDYKIPCLSLPLSLPLSAAAKPKPPPAKPPVDIAKTKPPPAKPPSEATPPPGAETTPPKSSEEWIEALDKLRSEFNEFKTQIRKELREEIKTLSDDLDQERKNNASLRIDIDRLKKMKL